MSPPKSDIVPLGLAPTPAPTGTYVLASTANSTDARWSVSGSYRTTEMRKTTPAMGADGGTAPQHALPALLRAALDGADDIRPLRDAVCRYVDTARERGDRVEHVIIDLKMEMRAAGAVDRYATSQERALAEGVIRWCIERFYGPAE